MKPWLWAPTKFAHDTTPLALPLISRFVRREPELPFTWRGLKFRNRYSIAGGVDKNARLLSTWQRLNTGFVEIGTVTPRPQSPNPGQIMDRDIGRSALWNKMGFPNQGAQEIAENVRSVRQNIEIPLWINIGRNRDTANEHAEEDYQKCAEAFKDLADGYVVNISSPNTKGLRDLQSGEAASRILAALSSFNKPILLKLSPDMEDATFQEFLIETHSAGVDGWIVSNTTTAKSGTDFTHDGGGVSGLPLRERSRQLLKLAVSTLGTKKEDRLLISAGGILTPHEAVERIRLGADLVETYSGLVFYGPKFFVDCVALERDGF